MRSTSTIIATFVVISNMYRYYMPCRITLPRIQHFQKDILFACILHAVYLYILLLRARVHEAINGATDSIENDEKFEHPRLKVDLEYDGHGRPILSRGSSAAIVSATAND